MNLFLGRFVPSPTARDIWELESDWQARFARERRDAQR